jgi:hypothetical protein
VPPPGFSSRGLRSGPGSCSPATLMHPIA